MKAEQRRPLKSEEDGQPVQWPFDSDRSKSQCFEGSNPTTRRPKRHDEATYNRLMMSPYTSFSATPCEDNKRSLSQKPIRLNSCTGQ
ncbi:hypothetical protein BDA96_10G318700 [Sorghum bicolor]|uniref:Uncharacterized protein n=2 Tax=Sorghum bicolor TaxID=4558 RepID=A0A921U2M5_SORBI|nr:hypothetical protein BDA96_10G318700 [Sorghum bicolor]OQU76980.1 hypothetical protein SORBI_3010G246650 [Sorghum bicolor]